MSVLFLKPRGDTFESKVCACAELCVCGDRRELRCGGWVGVCGDRHEFRCGGGTLLHVAPDLWVSVEDSGDVYKDTGLSVMVFFCFCFVFSDQRPSNHHGCGAGVRHPAKHHRKEAF